jgi:ketol-acid reductoisomerase
MKEILDEIQSGAFAKEWIAENRAGGENFDRMRKEAAGKEIEEIGGELRGMMPWIDQEF